jgi:hypothetical protein
LVSDTSSAHASEKAHKRTQNKRLKEGTGPSIAQSDAHIGGELKFQKNPAFIADRKKIFDELIEAQNNKYKGKEETSNDHLSYLTLILI